jgi:hypothetical protein
MGDGENGAFGKFLPDSSLNKFICLQVNGRSCLVQHQNLQ